MEEMPPRVKMRSRLVIAGEDAERFFLREVIDGLWQKNTPEVTPGVFLSIIAT
jgi:hypothetical protein